MTIKVGINGFGRVGRTLLRIAAENKSDDIQITALNARADSKTLAHLFKYDSNYGTFHGTIEAEEDSLIINGKEVKLISKGKPEEINWRDYGVDIVIESTGSFTKKEDAEKHIIFGGAKKVIITAPGKDEDITIVLGVNEKEYDPENHHVISNASCTTNCLAPFAKVLNDKLGIEKGLMTTIHSYTNDQRILDKTHKDLRRARSAAESIIPTTTGAAKAVAKVIPELAGKLNGFSLRVPTPTVSITDLVCEVKRDTTIEEVNNLLKEASETYMNGILGYSDEPLVSVDYVGDPRSSIIDGLSTMVTGGNMVKVVAWYDNEWGYTCRVYDLTCHVARFMK